MCNYILEAKSMLVPNCTEYWHGYTSKRKATAAKHREIAKMKLIHTYYRAWRIRVIKVANI